VVKVANVCKTELDNNNYLCDKLIKCKTDLEKLALLALYKHLQDVHSQPFELFPS